jgi:uncharacterized membrane protein YeaQ/YmgE (transglycosylase-associated protein family)
MMLVVLLVSWVVFGFLVGLIARALYPGTQAMGFGTTVGLGIVGSFAGGLIGNLLAGQPATYFHGAGIIGSVIGALVVMALVGVLTRARHA